MAGTCVGGEGELTVLDAATKFEYQWKKSSCGCPNVDADTDSLMNEFTSWSEAFKICTSPDHSGPEAFNAGVKAACDFCHMLCGHFALPSTESALSCQADEQACSWSRQYAGRFLTICKNVICRLLSCETTAVLSEPLQRCAPKLLYACFSYFDDDVPWSTEAARDTARELTNLLCKVCTPDGITGLLESSVGKCVLDGLQRQLTSETWRDHPQSVDVLLWYAVLASPITLQTNLDVLMALLLRLVDDGEASLEVSVRGADALTRLVNSASDAELKRYNRLSVLYDATKRHTYSHNGDLLAVILPLHATLCRAMGSCEDGSCARVVSSPVRIIVGSPRCPRMLGMNWNALDHYLSQLLSCVAGETSSELRTIYLENILSVVSGMGLQVVRHSQRILRFLPSHLGCQEGVGENCRFMTLAIMRVLVHSAWPRFGEPVQLVKALLTLCFHASCRIPHRAITSADFTDDPPAAWLKFCSDFKLSERRAEAVSLLSAVALSKHGKKQQKLNCYLLLGAVECLMLLAQCSASTATLLSSLLKDPLHFGLSRCVEMALDCSKECGPLCVPSGNIISPSSTNGSSC
ncbi:uncharacterized protein LOC135823948 [Sycon ciliatum]|uniref:uncharacterized protein LOC135823948 n=1 Tax=Sycon ciliatum TaxID=27933 RepID=UPI0031F63B7C